MDKITTRKKYFLIIFPPLEEVSNGRNRYRCNEYSSKKVFHNPWSSFIPSLEFVKEGGLTATSVQRGGQRKIK
jgi:hypothetical protein